MRLVGLDFADKQVVVVGGGAVATRRVGTLLDDGAVVRVVAPNVSDELERWAAVGAVTLERRDVHEGDVQGAWLVIAATDRADVNAAVATWAEAAHTWCINASDALEGSARMVAQSRHGEVLLGAMSVGAADPGRSRAVLAAIVGAVDAGAVPLRAHREGPGKVLLVGAGPGAADLMTVRARHALAQAHVVIHDRLGTEEIMQSLPAEVERIDVGKQPNHHPVPQEDINALLVEHAQAGKTVVRLKGGDPFVFGRGGEEVIACALAGVAVEVIPGITSAIAAPAAAGIPVTHRGVSSAVHISAAHEGLDDAALAALQHGSTVALLMGVGTLETSVTRALGAHVDPALSVAIIENGTLPHQRVTRGELSAIVRIATETGVKSPAVIVMGEVARPDLLAPP